MIFEQLQKVGKVFVALPTVARTIVVSWCRFFNIEIIEQAGKAIFDNLPAIFAVDISFGITKNYFIFSRTIVKFDLPTLWREKISEDEKILTLMIKLKS